MTRSGPASSRHVTTGRRRFNVKLMTVSLALSGVLFSASAVIQLPSFGLLGHDWKRYAATLAVGVLLATYFGWAAVHRRSLVAAFMGVTSSLLLAGVVGPLIYLIDRLSSGGALAFTLIMVAAWFSLLFRWQQVYRIVTAKTGVR